MSETKSKPRTKAKPRTATKEVKETKEVKAIESKDEMKATGKASGKIAKTSFQYNGKTHQKGCEILGIGEKELNELKQKGLVE